MAGRMSKELPVETLMECKICLESFKDPRTLPCLHTFCLRCLSQHTTTNASDDAAQALFKCPECRQEFAVPDGGAQEFPKNFFLNSLRDMTKARVTEADVSAAAGKKEDDGVQKCVNFELGEEHGNALSFCIECGDHYCEVCISAHKIVRSTRNHHIASVKSGKDATSSCPCPQHPKYDMEFYCKTCQILVCPKCCMLKHKEHEFAELSQSVPELEVDLEKVLQRARRQAQEVDSACSDMKTATGQMEEDFHRAGLHIKDSSKALYNLVDARQERLIDQLNNCRQKAFAEAKAINNELEMQSTNIKSFLSYGKGLLKSGMVEKVLHTSTLLKQLDLRESSSLPRLIWSSNFAQQAGSVASLDQSMEAVSMEIGANNPQSSKDKPKVKESQRGVTVGPVVRSTLLMNTTQKVNGMAVLDGIVCVTHACNPHVWLYNEKGTFLRQCTVDYIHVPRVPDENPIVTFWRSPHVWVYNQISTFLKHRGVHPPAIASDTAPKSIERPILQQVMDATKHTLLIRDEYNTESVQICTLCPQTSHITVRKKIQLPEDQSARHVRRQPSTGFLVIDAGQEVLTLNENGEVITCWEHNRGEDSIGLLSKTENVVCVFPNTTLEGYTVVLQVSHYKTSKYSQIVDKRDTKVSLTDKRGHTVQEHIWKKRNIHGANIGCLLNDKQGYGLFLDGEECQVRIIDARNRDAGVQTLGKLQHPTCMCLDENEEHLYVACDGEIKVFKYSNTDTEYAHHGSSAMSTPQEQAKHLKLNVNLAKF